MRPARQASGAAVRLAGALAVASTAVLAADEIPIVRVGVLVDGPWEQNEIVRQLTVAEVTTLTAGEFDVRFPERSYLVGDWSYRTAQENLERLLDDPEVDLVIAWGVLASQAVCCHVELPKPVVAPVILNSRLQGLPLDEGASGVPNLSYVELENKIDRELEIFHRIVPFEKIYFLTNASFSRAIPDLARRTFELAARAGFDVELVPVGDSADELLASIPSGAEAVYVWPQFHLPLEERQRLIDGLNARRLPSFSALAVGEVEAGMLATATSDDFFPRLVRRVALNVQRILLGEDAGRIPVLFSHRERVRINMATARAIGVSPGWDILREAELLHPEEAGREVMSLERAVREAIAANLDLLVRRRALAAAAQELALARSSYRPQVEISAAAAQIDADRALASFGARPELGTSVSLELSQVVFSDPALGAIRVERELQRSREEEIETLRLDIALEAATTFLNLLRAGSLLEIQRSNLEVTRSNLELARIRRTIGAANPAEVFRWESQIATDRKSLVEAQANQRAAEIALNRLLHRDLREHFVAAEVELDDPTLITGQERFEGYTETPARFRVLADFMVQEGLSAAPELRRLDAVIRAQERVVASARRAYWAPAVALGASFDQTLSRAGAGSDVRGFTIGSLTIPAADDSAWSVGLSASLALFSGGARQARLIQAEEELGRLSAELDAAAERIATRIRIGIEIARASFAGIELSAQAAEAARKSLALVSDSYARGAVSILDLLDAQNAALGAEQLHANAIYDFFVDLMEVQRAASRFDFFLTPHERDLWYRRLEGYFERAGDGAPAGDEMEER